MIPYRVTVSAEAQKDLAEIYHYVTIHDSPAKAEALLSALEAACLKLETAPNRGHYPKELERVGILLYREVHHKPYRIFYRVESRNVTVHAALDGRRDMWDLLERRLLRP